MTPLVTLLTDFGTADGYVAEMKGVILAAAPGATVLDVTHEIPPHDVDAGRLALARYWRRFPSGTVHLAVVDPGGWHIPSRARRCERRPRLRRPRQRHTDTGAALRPR